MANLEKLRPKCIKAINQYLQAKEITPNQLADRIGNISGETIRKMIGSRWDNISEQKWQLVWNYVNPERIEGITQTTDFKAGITAITKAKKQHCMYGIIGDTGTGKTTLLQVASRAKNTYYSYIDATVSPRVFLKELLKQLGAGFDGNLNAMLNKAVELLNMQVDPLLLIDESAKLSDKMILLIHSLRDRTINNMGIVLAGMPDFKNRLIRSSNRGTTGYSEFLRRIQVWHELQGLTTSEIKYILNANGITDEDVHREFKSFKKFGDLMNEITLYKEQNTL